MLPAELKSHAKTLLTLGNSLFKLSVSLGKN